MGVPAPERAVGVGGLFGEARHVEDAAPNREPVSVFANEDVPAPARCRVGVFRVVQLEALSSAEGGPLALPCVCLKRPM